MKVPLTIGASDFHLDRLGTGAWRRRPEITGDSWFGLSQIIDYCLQFEVPLLAGGDLIDMAAQDDSSIIQFVMQEMKRLAEKSLQAYFIQGQHEFLRVTPWWGLNPNAVHLNQKSVVLKGRHIFGLDYARPEFLATNRALIPKDTDILMAHQVWIDLMGEHLGGECRFKEVPFAKVMLTGDFHQHKTVITQNEQNKSMLVLSPGSTCMRSIDEVTDKYVFLIYDDLSVKSLPLKTRPIHRFCVKNADQLDELVEQLSKDLPAPAHVLPTELQRAIVHVYHDPNIADAYSRLHAVAKDKFHLFLTPKQLDVYTDMATISTTENLETIDVDQSLTDVLGQIFNKESPEYELASELLLSDKPADALTRAETTFFAQSKSTNQP